MNNTHRLLLAACFGSLLAGCTSTSNLVFVDQNKFALSIGGSVPDQKADLTVGYSSYSAALVPVIKDTNSIMATSAGRPAGATNYDALSVFARFGAKGGAATNQTRFELGRVFATGVAAQLTAAGYAQALTNATATGNGIPTAR